MKTEIKAIIVSVVVLAACLVAVGGVTYSWFSDTEQSDVDVTTGTLSVTTSDYVLTDVRTNTQLATGAQLPAEIELSNVVANREYTVEYTATFEYTVDAVYRIYAGISNIDAGQSNYIITSISATDSTDAPADLSQWTSATLGDSEKGTATYDVTVTIKTTKQYGDGLDASVPHGFTVSVVNEIYQGDAYGLIFDTDTQTVEIGSAVELYALADAVNSGAFETGGEYAAYAGYTFVLTDDIDLEGAEWTPIGTLPDKGAGQMTSADVEGFAGTFDGQNHTVSNFTIIGNITTEFPSGYPVGLFGVVEGTVKNLNVKDVTIDSQQLSHGNINGAGAVAGVLWNPEYASNEGMIENVTVSNAIINGSHFVGGVVGYIYRGNVTNSSVSDTTITVVPNEYQGSYDNGDKVGGIVGYIMIDGDVTGNSVSNVSLKAYRDVGGVVGTVAISNVTISNNIVNGLSITVDQTTNSYGAKDPNGGEIVGRDTTNGAYTSSGNTFTDCTIETVTQDSEKISTNDPETVVEALSNGQNLTLSGDVEVTGSITIPAGSTSTLDLGDHTLKSDGYTLMVRGNLTITGNGTVEGGSSTTPAAGSELLPIFATGNAVLTIDGGTYVGHDCAEVVFVSGNATVIINDGTFQSTRSDNTAWGYLLNISNSALSTAEIVVNGGTFYNYNPTSGDDQGKTSFVAPGKTVSTSTVGSDTVYTVADAAEAP